MTKILFAKDKDVAILVAHETYTCIEENSNYSFQRRSFSMYKGSQAYEDSTIGDILDFVFG